MQKISFKLLIFTILILVICSPVFSLTSETKEDCACSKSDKIKVREYFKNLEKQDQLIAEYRKKNLSQSGKLPILIAGGCEWTNNGCPVSLVKPKVPTFVKNLKISGTVKVEIIISKSGEVIYAKAITGNKVFYNSAVRAACKSRFSPKIICGKEIMQKRTIRYRFIL